VEDCTDFGCGFFVLELFFLRPCSSHGAFGLLEDVVFSADGVRVKKKKLGVCSSIRLILFYGSRHVYIFFAGYFCLRPRPQPARFAD